VTEGYEEKLGRVTLGAPERLSGRVELSDYDPRWAERYECEAERVRGALGAHVRRLEHVGSTSVPGLAAKPIVDIVLEVPDSSEESGYVPALQTAGYVLRIREADWLAHRMLTGEGVNLHVFSAGCPETERMVRFRDWLVCHPSDRELYARTKHELAAREWSYVQQYADAKSGVIRAILARAEAP
jgi:GrpB-like predicted nucleotidyltransferase (UPF0157 family)